MTSKDRRLNYKADKDKAGRWVNKKVRKGYTELHVVITNTLYFSKYSLNIHQSIFIRGRDAGAAAQAEMPRPPSPKPSPPTSSTYLEEHQGMPAVSWVCPGASPGGTCLEKEILACDILIDPSVMFLALMRNWLKFAPLQTDQWTKLWPKWNVYKSEHLSNTWKVWTP